MHEIPAIAKCAALFMVLVIFALRFLIDDDKPPGAP